jgi:hypothetical protein
MAPHKSKPLLLVDVDGVLNPYAAESCPEGYREYSFFPGEEPVWLCELHGRWLSDLASVFDLVWATGWGAQAHLHISPVLRLPRFPAIELPVGPFDPAEKVPAVDAYVGDRPLAWIDDMLTSEAQLWAAKRAAPTLLVPVDPAVGLSERIVNDLRRWAARLT